ncbi:TolC family protein [Oryzomicrobium sp.]|uniref:TolC family protein n=1 Tax=Oryzomicrobium sp. TaxID=1911578 RepID=UPI002FE1638F
MTPHFPTAVSSLPLTLPLSLLLALLLAAPDARAETGDGLPAAAEVKAAIAAAPLVAAARADLSAESANRERLDAGPHEWTTRLMDQRRRLRSTPSEGPGGPYNEWLVTLERPLRLPAKADADRALGEQGESTARIAVEDAQHETARQLLAAWFQWLRTRVAADQAQTQAKLLARLADSTGRRLKLGDAARLEAMQAEAAAAQADAQWQQARARLQAASEDLRARFPAIAQPERVSLPAPEPLEGTLAAWQERIAGKSHELALAGAETRQARLAAQRAEAERTPDPVFGVHVGSERGGEEKLVGVSVTIPLPGAARGAAARSQAARANAASYREDGLRRQVSADIASRHALASATQIAWQRADQAARQLEASADLTARAQSLGEAPLAEVLLARRQAGEGRLAAEQTRLDALEARYRLELDAHQLWDYDVD